MFRRRIGRLLVILVLAGTLAVMVAAPVLAWRWIQKPFPGLLFEQTLIVSGIRDKAWGVDVPPNPSVRLAAVDGVVLDTAQDLNRLMRELPLGARVTLTLEYRDLSPPSQVQAELQQFSLVDWGTLFWLPYAIGLVYLVIGIWVFRHRGDHPAGRSFALFCAFVALATGTLFDMSTTQVFVRVWTAALPLTAAALVHVSLVFPEEEPFTRRRPAFRLLPYLLAIGLIAIAQVRLYDPNDPWAYIAPWRWSYIALGVSAAVFVFRLLLARSRTVSGIVRQQVRIILLGSVLAFSPIAIYMLIAGLAISGDFQPALYLPPLVIFPLFVAYAILRYKLLGMDLVISRGLAYTILTAGVAGAYFLTLAVLSRTLGINIGGGHPLLLALFIITLIFILNPLRTSIEHVVDRLLGQQRVDYRAALQNFSRELVTTPLDLAVLLERLLDQLKPVSHAAPALVFLHDPRTGSYTLRRASGFVPPDGQEIRLAQDSDLAAWLGEEDGPVYLPETGSELFTRKLSAGERKTIEDMGSVLFLPLRGQRQLTGWVALGPRLSGEPYSPDDLAFLSSLVDQTAIALENAQLLENLEEQVIRLDALRQIGEAVDLRQGLEDLLSLIYGQTCRLMQVDNFYAALYDQTHQEFRMAYYVEERERRQPPSLTWSLGTGLTSQIVRQREPIVTDDYLAECERRGVPASGKPARAWLGVPLVSGPEGQVLGVLNVSSFQPGYRYTGEQVQLMRTIADQAAIAIDRMRLYQEMEMRVAELATLYEVSRILSSTLDLPSVLDLIMNKVIEILDVEAGSLLLLDEEAGDMVFEVALGAAHSQKLIGRRYPVGKGIIGHVVQSGQAEIVNHVQADPRWDQEVDEELDFHTRSILCVPLSSRNHVIGAIEVMNRRDGRPFQADEANLLVSFAAQAAVAIENARLYTQTDQALARRVEELSTMQRIDRELNAALDIDRVMQMTIEWALRGTGAPVGVIALYDASRDGLLLLASQGYPAGFERYRSEPWPLDEGIVGRVVRSAEPALVEDVDRDPDYRPAQPSTRSQLSVPIRREGRVIGVVNLESPELGAFGDDDLAFLQRLADHAAIAIENARLHAETQKRLQEQVALREAGAAISSALDIEVVLSHIVEEMARAVDATSAYINSYDPGSRLATVLAEYIGPEAASEEKVSDLGMAYEEDEEGWLDVIAAGWPDISHLDDPDLNDLERSHMERFGAKTILYIPLLVKGQLIGFAELWESRRRREFAPEEIALCQGIAQQAAIALENARLYQETQRRLLEVTLLFDTSAAVSKTLDLEKVLHTTARQITAALGADGCTIATWDREEDVLVTQLDYSRDQELWEPEAPGTTHPLTSYPSSRQSLSERQSLVLQVRDPDADPVAVAWMKQEGVKSLLMVPLVVRDEAIGLLQLMQAREARAFTDTELALCQTMANQAAAALENAKLYEGVKQANQAKSEFIDFVAHELKQPMTSMQGYAKMLTMGMGGELTETQKQFVEVITKNVDRMGKLVQDLLEISRLEAGRTQLRLAPVNLQEVVEETITNTRTEIEARHHTLEVRTPSDLPLVLGDRERLVQILTNLVSNAYKYTPEGGKIRIDVDGRDRTNLPPGHVCVSVSDTGIGMSAAELSNLEEKFFRADHDLVQQQPGTGLGVSITRNLVELHGGEFLIESKAGKGSTFRFTVPIANTTNE